MTNLSSAMPRHTAVQVIIALVGVLLSAGLGLGAALSLDGGPSPTPGNWTMLFFAPFFLLNPWYMVVLGIAQLLSLPGWCVGLLGLAGSIAWWWFLGGIAARRIARRRA